MRKSKLFAVLLATTMIFQSFLALNVVNPVSANDYSDVEGHWAEKQIAYLTSNEIINGFETEDGVVINPDAEMTRAEFITVLVNSMKYELVEGQAIKFKDVQRRDWFKKSVDIATSNGIVSGYPDSTFRPDQIITRAEIAALIVKVNKWTAADIGRGVKGFDDVSESDWYFTILMILKSKKIINGYADNTFRPNQTSTRAEAFASIYNLIVDEDETITDPDDEVPAAGGGDDETVTEPDDEIPTTGGSDETQSPQVEDSTLETSGVNYTQVTVSWNKATDDETEQVDLEYAVYYSSSDNINDVQDILDNGTQVSDFEKDLDSKLVSGLNSGNTYFFNVIVKDEDENMVAYTSKSARTTSNSSGGGGRTAPTPTPTLGDKLSTIGSGQFDGSQILNADAVNIVNNYINDLEIDALQLAFGSDENKTETFRVAFEDLSPYISAGNDLDYNDFVFDMKVIEFYNNSILRAVVVTLDPQARGAGYNHALELALQGAYNSTGNDFMFNWLQAEPNGLVTIDNIATNYNNNNDIEVFDNTKTILPAVPGTSYSNTVSGQSIPTAYTGGLMIVLGNADNNVVDVPVIEDYEPILTPSGIGAIKATDQVGSARNAMIKDIEWLWPQEKVNINDAYENDYTTVKEASKLYN